MSSLLQGLTFVNKDEDTSKANKKKHKGRESKDKPKKKKSKHKHRKQKKRKHSSDSSTDSSDNDQPPSAPEPSQSTPRDEWMSMSFETTPTTEQKTEEDVEEEERLSKHDQEVASGLRDPHSGLRYGLYDPKKESSTTQSDSTAPRKPLVGDGGASWRAKMLQRCKDKAAQTGESLESLVMERFGSLDVLQESFQDSARPDAHLHYRRHADTSSRSNSKGRRLPVGRDASDKTILSSFSTRVQRSAASSFPTDDVEEEDRVDYSKLPDFEEAASRPQRHPGRQKRSGSPRRHGTREVPPKKHKAEDKEEIDRRKAFLYGGPTPPASKTPETKKEEATGEEDLNALAAKALRAQMRGQTELFHKLRDQLNDAEAKQHEASVAADSAFYPVAGPAPPLEKEDLRRGSRQGKKERREVSEDMSLEEMVREERTAKAGFSRGDMDEVQARNIVRLGGRYKDSDAKQSSSGFDEEDQVGTKMLQRPEDRLTRRKRQEYDQQKTRMDERKWDERTRRCGRCRHSEAWKSHLTVALGESTYLAIPSAKRLHEAHCVIVPIDHLSSFTQSEEDVYIEMRRFQKELTQMCLSVFGMGVVFLEQTQAPGRKRHTVVECVPVPMEIAQDAPMYFKQELMQVDEEWSTHKKVIDIKDGGVRRHVPKQFAYFSMEWRDGDKSGGYAHVIEDSEQFPRDFGVGVVAGMLEMDPPRYNNREKQSVEEEVVAVRAFRRHWDAFDWTKELDAK